MRMITACAALAFSAIAAMQGAWAATTPAAEVLLLTGRGTATDPASGEVRELAKGDSVFPGEVISSSVNSYVNLKFADGSFILLRPNTRFVVEEYAYAGATPAATAPAAPPPAAPPPPPVKSGTSKPAPGAKVTVPPPPPVATPPPTTVVSSTGSRAFFRLLKGGFRAVSGLIGHTDRNEYRVSTPVATIGIRGTDYIAVICDTACARDPVVREDLPAGVGAEGGLVTGVITGGIGVASDGRAACLDAASGEIKNAANCTTTELAAGSFMVVTADRQHVPLASTPRFLTVDPIPNPTTICSQ